MDFLICKVGSIIAKKIKAQVKPWRLMTRPITISKIITNELS